MFLKRTSFLVWFIGVVFRAPRFACSARVITCGLHTHQELLRVVCLHAKSYYVWFACTLRVITCRLLASQELLRVVCLHVKSYYVWFACTPRVIWAKTDNSQPVPQIFPRLFYLEYKLNLHFFILILKNPESG